ncbi:TPA: hypothetical protein DCZ32_02475, partial [Candidatus Uhrbacteria bacterium]|nr:hypothetical protein [Candidatus Uhrbacteria bacterium]
ATERCNGQDDDCNGLVPAAELDSDFDGVSSCEGDCAPLDPSVNPSATEVCDNGQDDDCDGADVSCLCAGLDGGTELLRNWSFESGIRTPWTYEQNSESEFDGSLADIVCPGDADHLGDGA